MPLPFPAPHPHQPRRRARQRAVVVALVALLGSSSVAASSSAASTSSSPFTFPSLDRTGDVLLDGTRAYGAVQDVGGWQLQARAETVEEEEAASTTVRRRQAVTSDSAATAGATAVASIDPAASTVLSLEPSVATSAASASLAVASSTDAGSGTATSTSSSAISTSTTVPDNYQLPEAFDSTIGTNFTSTACPSFFATFLADSTFTSCAPFSLLLTTSSAFFTAERSPYSLLPYVLDASCGADSSTCSTLMDTLARQIKQSSTCGPDLDKGNPLATEALQGFLNYRMYRELGCQKSNATEQRYCFADAAANSQPDDLYLYYAGEGTSLPSGTTPDCGYCTQGLFSIYSRYASNSSLAISKTYSSARSAVAVSCGPDFAPIISATTTSGAGSSHSRSPLSSAPALVLAAIVPALLLASGAL
ncbi:hypothetical protein JCM8097_002567 [Rhodosporidiobolus ruineniae]